MNFFETFLIIFIVYNQTRKLFKDIIEYLEIFKNIQNCIWNKFRMCELISLAAIEYSPRRFLQTKLSLFARVCVATEPFIGGAFSVASLYWYHLCRSRSAKPARPKETR